MTQSQDDADPTDVPDVDELAESDEPIERIADGRYLIELDDSPADGHAQSLEGARASRAFEDVADRYAVEVAAKTDRGVRSTRFASDDVRDVFRRLVLWYADQLDRETPRDEALQLLLEHTDLLPPNDDPNPIE